MIYHSIEFIFFLAFSLYFFFVTPGKYRIFILLGASLFWYSSWNLQWLYLYLGIFILNYFLLWLAERIHWQQKKFFFPCLIILDVLIFIFLKGRNLWDKEQIPPYGVSFFMFMLIGLVIDRWRQKEQPLQRIPVFMSMLFFFPLLVGGPIERGKDFFPQLKNLQLKKENLVDGILVFSYGFMKRFLLGLPLEKPMQLIFTTGNLHYASLALAALLSTFQAYIDFSSYCDMGRGAALCFGLKIKFNFKPFYYARNPHDFWQRWNITIGTWMRDYVTFPLMFRFGRKLKPSFLVFFSFILIGLWHGLHWNWFFFGIFNGVLVALYLSLQPLLRHSKKLLAFCGFLLVLILFCGNGLLQHSQAGELLKQASQTHYMNSAFQDADWILQMKALSWIALAFLIFEFFQERFDDLDFYLRASPLLKQGLSIGFCLWLLYMLHFGLIADYKFDLPLYFRF